MSIRSRLNEIARILNRRDENVVVQLQYMPIPAPGEPWPELPASGRIRFGEKALRVWNQMKEMDARTCPGERPTAGESGRG